MKLSEIARFGRGIGKTFRLAQAAKAINGILLVCDQSEAKRVSYEYNCDARPIDADLRGCNKPVLVDTDAVAFYAYRAETLIDELNLDSRKQSDQITALMKEKSILESEIVRLVVALKEASDIPCSCCDGDSRMDEHVEKIFAACPLSRELMEKQK